MSNTYTNIDSYNPQILFVIDGYCSPDIPVPETNYHCHEDFIELSFVTSGSVDYLIEGEEYTLKKGQVLISNPGIYHKELFNSNTNCRELHLGLTDINIFNNCKKDFIDIGDKNVLTLNTYKDEILKTCQDIVDEQKNHKQTSPFMLKSLVMKVLVLLHREINEEIPNLNSQEFSFKSREKKVLVESITKYLNENYTEDISLYTLSKNMYLSPVYISKIFKELMGDSPINYLIQIRLIKAKNLLEDSKLSIKTIAKMVGYNDPYYFSKLYKKYYGISPNKARKIV
ncbi:AraC family transcriptional regulator [Clostridium sartagoforme AAU1]|jgi:YesN/AraC family two-component response regulator|uniref:AraC family transcriptional regulator n=1 Tax=Clostridium sartagoforme AAU1 TaxID=1202534 RepID=R9CFP5_9CLOT|nr:AraC family transcriptional regulator [Clostridium sartagoforme]EOR28169.1 AraC family transcriptional regulator [Clostridium sartagoforme AAU1]